MPLPKIIFLTGPTAAGKSAMAVPLAKKFNGEIISADSRQIYRGMDIGTAKATKKQRQQIPHHLIDLKNPNQTYTLAHFKKNALKAIKQITKRGKIPFVVGGTALYVNALINNWKIPRIKPNPKLRRSLERQIQTRGLDFVYQKLIRLDPDAANIVDCKNPRRIIRALEIAQATKRPLSASRQKGPPLFQSLILGMAIPETKLKQRIVRRTITMMRQGFFQEVKNLTKKYNPRLSAFDAIGYRELISHLQKKITLPETVALINKNTWRFTKRQQTWFKRMPIVWIKTQTQAETKIKKFLL